MVGDSKFSVGSRRASNPLKSFTKTLLPRSIQDFLFGGSVQWLITNRFFSNFPSHRIRRHWLIALGARIGKSVAIYGGCEFRNLRQLVIGEGSSIGHRCVLDARKGLTIGRCVTLGTEVMIWTLQHDYNDVHFKAVGEPVSIGSWAWLGSRAILLPGVSIGEGAVVAAGAVVTKDVSPYDVVAGVPARVVSKRNRQEMNYCPGLDRMHMV